MMHLTPEKFPELFSSLLMQKGQSDHTVPICRLHQVHCSTDLHKMIPLTELSLLSIQPDQLNYLREIKVSIRKSTKKRKKQKNSRGTDFLQFITAEGGRSTWVHFTTDTPNWALLQLILC